MGLPDSMATSPPRPRSPRTASLAHTATETDIGEVRSMMATNADLHAAVQCKPEGTSYRRWDQLHAKADETQVRVSKVHAQEAQQVALLSQPSERFHDRVFIAAKRNRRVSAEPSGGPPACQRATHRARLAGPDERAGARGRAAGARAGGGQRNAAQARTLVQCRCNSTGRTPRSASQRDPENKLRDQVAVLKARVGRLQACGAGLKRRQWRPRAGRRFRTQTRALAQRIPTTLSNRRAVAAAAPRWSVFASSRYDWSAAARGPWRRLRLASCRPRRRSETTGGTS
ncbi:hypothetical protein EDB83DRAFT_708837 [Lactarius deliciosus]|nr:hypothetical protein EDB83DRAFT_708837 [Lactarius deliciosus]